MNNIYSKQIEVFNEGDLYIKKWEYTEGWYYSIRYKNHNNGTYFVLEKIFENNDQMVINIARTMTEGL